MLKFEVGAAIAVFLALGGAVHLGGIALLQRAQADWHEGNREALRALGSAGVAREASVLAVQVAQAAAAPKVVDGAKIYGEVCAACHQPNGAGLAGAFPPLAESEWVAKEPRILARIVLGGLQGPISVKGVTYNAAMPGFSQLSDAEIAAVLTHVRSSFGNASPAIDADAIKVVRDEGGAKAGGWTAESVGL